MRASAITSEGSASSTSPCLQLASVGLPPETGRTIISPFLPKVFPTLPGPWLCPAWRGGLSLTLSPTLRGTFVFDVLPGHPKLHHGFCFFHTSPHSPRSEASDFSSSIRRAVEHLVEMLGCCSIHPHHMLGPCLCSWPSFLGGFRQWVKHVGPFPPHRRPRCGLGIGVNQRMQGISLSLCPHTCPPFPLSGGGEFVLDRPHTLRGWHCVPHVQDLALGLGGSAGVQ